MVDSLSFRWRARVAPFEHWVLGAVQELRRCATRNNVAVASLLVVFGVYLQQSSQPHSTFNQYIVVNWGSSAEQASLVDELAREQAESMHLPILVERLSRRRAELPIGACSTASVPSPDDQAGS